MEMVFGFLKSLTTRPISEVKSKDEEKDTLRRKYKDKSPKQILKEEFQEWVDSGVETARQEFFWLYCGLFLLLFFFRHCMQFDGSEDGDGRMTFIDYSCFLCLLRRQFSFSSDFAIPDRTLTQITNSLSNC